LRVRGTDNLELRRGDAGADNLKKAAPLLVDVFRKTELTHGNPPVCTGAGAMCPYQAGTCAECSRLRYAQ
jgi:hypothetical protein